MKTFKSIFLISFLLTIYSCKDCTPCKIYYTEKESYEEDIEVEETLSYEVIGDGVKIERIGGSILGGTNPSLTGSVIIRNTTKYDGEFSLTVEVECLGQKATLFGNANVPAFGTREIAATSEVTPFTFEVENFNSMTAAKKITPPTVVRTEKVTKQRDVQKERQCDPCKETCLCNEEPTK